MNSTLKRSKQFGLLVVAALTCVVATSLVGCVSRRQYAINESILISERRQLEDEIYRVQFELRDALEENEQLRARLEENEGDSARTGKSRKSSSRAQKTTAPAYERPQTTDEKMFPGGDALRANTSSHNDRYPEYPTLDMNEISKLPDFALVPKQSDETRANAKPAAPQARQAAYDQPRRRPGGVSQVSYEDAEEECLDEEEYGETEDAEDERVDEAAEYDEDLEEEPLESHDDDEEPEEEENEWAPTPE